MKILRADATVEAVREGLRELAIASEGKAHRTYAVVGELPGSARDELMDLGRFLVRLDITSLVVVGDAPGGIHAGAVLEGSWGAESRHVGTAAEALILLGAELAADDVVLVAGLPSVLTALEGAA